MLYLLGAVYDSERPQDNFIPDISGPAHNASKIYKELPFGDSSHENMTLTLLDNSFLNINSSSLYSWASCLGLFQSPNHALFQVANSFLLLSYVAPMGTHGWLYLRTTLLLSSIFFALWGWLDQCALDTFIWNAVFTLLNCIHIVYILYTLRPAGLSKELEEVYKELFRPLKVSRRHFKGIVSCMREIKCLKPREPYCVEDVTKVDRLSLVLSGRLVVSQHGHPLHIVDSKQFLDSPEWFGVCTNDTYQVSITAIEECSVLIWHRDKLKLSISSDPYMQTVLDNILGKDVVKKLLLVSEAPCNGVGFYVCDDVVAETTKLLSINKQGQTGLSVLLTRQVKNRDTNVWNLAKKGSTEHESETSV